VQASSIDINDVIDQLKQLRATGVSEAAIIEWLLGQDLPRGEAIVAWSAAMDEGVPETMTRLSGGVRNLAGDELNTVQRSPNVWKLDFGDGRSGLHISRGTELPKVGEHLDLPNARVAIDGADVLTWNVTEVIEEDDPLITARLKLELAADSES
jgi:hypothetical protein